MVWAFSWLHGWVYANILNTFFHLQHVLLQKGKGQGKGKGKVKGKFNKCGTDSTGIEAVEGNIRGYRELAEEDARDCR